MCVCVCGGGGGGGVRAFINRNHSNFLQSSRLGVKDNLKISFLISQKKQML